LGFLREDHRSSPTPKTVFDRQEKKKKKKEA
jgi:hypothetical protein